MNRVTKRNLIWGFSAIVGFATMLWWLYISAIGALSRDISITLTLAVEAYMAEVGRVPESWGAIVDEGILPENSAGYAQGFFSWSRVANISDLPYEFRVVPVAGSEGQSTIFILKRSATDESDWRTRSIWSRGIGEPGNADELRKRISEKLKDLAERPFISVS